MLLGNVDSERNRSVGGLLGGRDVVDGVFANGVDTCFETRLGVRLCVLMGGWIRLDLFSNSSLTGLRLEWYLDAMMLKWVRETSGGGTRSCWYYQEKLYSWS
jgi:hypothetical protein